MAGAWIALTSPLGGDYAQAGCTRAYACDDPAVSIRALASGNMHDFFALQPTMGLVSLVLRAPFAAFGRLLDNSDLTVYRLGVFACILATGATGLWLAVTARRRLGITLAAATAFAIAWVINPVTFRTIFWGHPEEAVCAALVCASAVFAYLGQWRLAAILLALSFATKQPAALAAPAILLMVPAAKRVPFTLIAVAVTALLVVPMYLGDQGRFRHVNERLTADAASATPTNIWWQATVPAKVGYSAGARRPKPFPQKVSHWLIAGAALILPFVWWRRRWNLLGVIPIVMLLRCVLDPLSYSYHHDLFLLGVLTFEVFALRRFPYAAAAAVALLQLTIWLAPRVDTDVLQAIYVVWTVAFCGYLAWASARAAETRAVLR